MLLGGGQNAVEVLYLQLVVQVILHLERHSQLAFSLNIINHTAIRNFTLLLLFLGEEYHYKIHAGQYEIELKHLDPFEYVADLREFLAVFWPILSEVRADVGNY